MEIEIPPQSVHRISVAIGRRPGVWTDIPERKVVADLGHLHANIVPAAHATWVDDPTPGRFAFLRLDAERFGAWLGDEGRRFAPRPAFNLGDALIARIARILIHRIENGRATSSLALDTFATRIALRLAHLAEQSPVPPSRFEFAPWELRRIDEFIEANLADALDLDALARLVDRPRLHFLQGFVSAFRAQPHAHVAALRLRRARRMIEAGDASAPEIASACGFGSEHDLTHAFRALIGIDPSAYERLRG